MEPRALARLGIDITGDPVAVLDDDLRRLHADLKGRRGRGEHAAARLLAEVIDLRLDERQRLTTDPYRSEATRTVTVSGMSRARARERTEPSLLDAAEAARARIARAVATYAQGTTGHQGPARR